MQAPRKTRAFVALICFAALTPCLAIAKSIVLFSPDDKPTNHLIQKLGEAKTRIYAAVYMLTDKKIAHALVDAKNRGVDVQIVTDQATTESPYGKADILKQGGIKLDVYYLSHNGYTNFNPLMHHKFAVIDNNVWTGSFNWTISANNKNQENVIYTDEKDVCEKYLDQFEKLKHRCAVNAEKRKKLLEKAAAQAAKVRRKVRGQRLVAGPARPGVGVAAREGRLLREE